MFAGLWSEKYRPKSLEDIGHHNDIIDKLGTYVRDKQMPHQLFFGPRGVGKTTCLVAFANARARKILEIPGKIYPLDLISVGYPAEEKEPRTQYNEDRVHLESW